MLFLLRSLGVEPRYTGRREITALVRKLLEIYQTELKRLFKQSFLGTDVPEGQY